MMASDVTLVLEKGRKRTSVPAKRVEFAPYRCFRFDGGADERECLRVLADHLMAQPGLAIYGNGDLFDSLAAARPGLSEHVEAVITDETGVSRVGGHAATTLADLPARVETVFLSDVETFPRIQKRGRLPSRVKAIGPEVLAEIAPEIIPARAWIPMVHNIYPLAIPEIRFEKNLDMVLLDCPARNLALMPNGLGYVHNTLKKTSIKFQTFDLDIVTYHRFQIRRLFDEGGRIVLPDGRELPADPWQAEHYDLWADESVIAYFEPIMDEAVEALVAAKPKALGMSIHACNEAFSRRLARRVKGALPDTIIVVGGFSCYNADIGRRGFPIADYMCIGEADLTVGPLVEALARGERPRNQPGVMSRYDTPDHAFIPAPMPHNLDRIDFPTYDWCDLSLYRNFNDYQLTPVIASRGCRWSRCTFCAERFYWRIRSAKNFVDELEWLIGQGCTLFMFNESDLNGMPEKLLEICDEIIGRGIKVKLTGQLRIHNRNDKAFYEKLAKAGFVALRFGVDAFSRNTLKLQKKGYTVATISQNLRDCWNAGIYTEVNWVIGVPGETEADVDEGIALILANKQYIGRLANINPLILSNGGVYWLEPDKHNIRFRRPKDELYAQYPRALPADEWYSVEPYIDSQVRKKWFEKIVLTLHDSGFPVGAWATRIIEDVKLARDRSRVGSGVGQGESAPEETPVEKWPDTAPQATARADTAMIAEEKVVAELETHRIVFFKNMFYGVPRALGEVRLSDVDLSQLAGMLEDDTEEGLRIQIEEASNWADSRGHYNAQNRQRSAGSYMRVDSAATEGETTTVIPKGARIIEFAGNHYAIDVSASGMPANGGAGPQTETAAVAAAADIGGPGGNSDAAPALPASPSFIRRALYLLLPRSLQGRIRAILSAQRSKNGVNRVLSDGESLSLLLKGIAHRVVGPDDKPRVSPRKAFPGMEGSYIVNAITVGATPEMMCAVGNYNLVRFDGKYYGVPQGYAVCWTEGNVDTIPGVIVAETTKEALRVLGEVSADTGAAARPALAVDADKAPPGNVFHLPWLLGSKEGYNIVSYEGWIYGIPQSLGSLDLTEVDIMEMPGVIRDVSRDTVELEISEHSKMGDERVAVGQH